jgi:PAS domain-containing protein
MIGQIEDRTLAGDALHASEDIARLIMDGIPSLVVRMAPTGEVETVNRQVLEYFGKRYEDLTNWAESGIVRPDDLPRSIEISLHSFANALHSGWGFGSGVSMAVFAGSSRAASRRETPRDE